MRLYLVKRDLGFWPYSDLDEEKAKKIPKGEAVYTEYSRDRNYRHHAKFFVLVQFIQDHLPEGFKNYDYHVTKEGILSTVKLLTGYSEMIYNPRSDRFEEKPRSIRFEKMDQEAFEDFYSKAIDKMLAFYIEPMGDQAVEEFLKISR